MAKKSKRITDEVNEPRSSITVKNAVLWSGFLVLVVVAIFTVMLPELQDDGAQDEADAVARGDEDADEDAAHDDADGQTGDTPAATAP